MTGEVIKSFLVGLGFGVDEASLAKFNKAIASATIRVGALATAVEGAAAGIVYGISEVSDSFEKMGYEYRIIAPAINKALILRRELLRAYSAAGVNIVKVIQNSVRLNMSLAKTKFAFKAIYDSVASRFFTLLTKQSDLFRERLYKNLPQIQNFLEHLIKVVFGAFEGVNILGARLFSILGRVFEFFAKLDKATNHWSTAIFAIIAAWRLLNLSFLATPLGAILALGTALLALYDDFETFKEGGKSLIDWSSFVPVVDAIKRTVSGLVDLFRDLLQVIFALVDSFVHLLTLDFSGWWFRVKLAAESALNVFKDIVKHMLNILNLGGALKDWGFHFFGNNAQGALNNVQPLVGPPSNPIGSGVQNSQTNQNVHQQTNINVIGSADANATGKVIAGHQSRTNYDLVNNLKGSTR